MSYFALTIATALLQAQPPLNAGAGLGPIRVTASAVDNRMHWITYTVRSDLTEDVGVTFWSFEILRVYADGSQIVSVQEQDFLESQVSSCASVGSLLDFSRGFRPSTRFQHASPNKDIGRLDAPVQVRVVPTAVMLSDGSVFGDLTRIDQVVARRQVFVQEYAAWLRRTKQAQAALPGLMGLRYFADQLSDPQLGAKDVTNIREAFQHISSRI